PTSPPRSRRRSSKRSPRNANPPAPPSSTIDPPKGGTGVPPVSPHAARSKAQAGRLSHPQPRSPPMAKKTPAKAPSGKKTTKKAPAAGGNKATPRPKTAHRAARDEHT